MSIRDEIVMWTNLTEYQVRVSLLDVVKMFTLISLINMEVGINVEGVQKLTNP